MEAAEEFAKFMDEHPTVFHFTDGIKRLLSGAGFMEFSERDPPKLERGGKYYVQRNGSSIVAFEVGQNFIPGPDGFTIIAGHIDANRMCLKPTSTKPDQQGYLRLGTTPYGGPALSSWWDRDLAVGGRVVVKSNDMITTRLVRIPGTIGSIPSLAGHFGSALADIKQANRETNFVPVISASTELTPPPTESEQSAPISQKHPLLLLRAIAKQAHCKVEDILEMELELFSDEKVKPNAGLGHDLLYSSRLDDKLCSYTAIKSLIQSSSGSGSGSSDHTVKMVALYDNEEIGSLTRAGGFNKLMEGVMSLICRGLYATDDEEIQSAANSIMLSADVTHAVNPNYVNAYSEGHMPRLNTGMTVKQLGRFTSTAVDAAICELISERANIPLQRFAPRNDTASGGTIGPMRAASSGIRTIDVGIPVMAMHSIREVTGTKDVSLGIKWFQTFFEMSNELTHDEDIYLASR